MNVIDDILLNNEILEVLEDAIPEKPKSIWVLTEKRKIALEQGRLKRDENARLRKEAREIKIQREMEKYEEYVLKKAISIKKRHIKNDYLRHIEDDDTPDNIIKMMNQELRKPLIKQQQEQQQPQPQYKQPQPSFIFI